MTSAPIMNTYKRWPLEVISGRGSHVYDASGRAYLDLVGGIAVCSVGHSHPRVAQAIAEQASKLIHVSNLYETEPQKELARQLATISGGKHSFFANSGAEAVECAIKLARKRGRREHGGDTRIVAATGSFHGRTLGALAATGQPAKQAPFEPLPGGFTHVPYGSVDDVAGAMGPDVCAVLVEPIQDEAGVVVPEEGYLEGLKYVCDAWGALLIVDEVQTGLGRTGRWFGYEHDEVRPDVLCLAKALGGGLPIGACLAEPDVARHFEPGDHATTFGGGPVQSNAALAVLDVIADEGLVEASAKLGEAALHRLATLPGCSARGRGLLIGIDLGRDAARSVADGCLARGVLVNDVTASVVRIAPPLNIDENDLNEGLDILEEVVGEV